MVATGWPVSGAISRRSPSRESDLGLAHGAINFLHQPVIKLREPCARLGGKITQLVVLEFGESCNHGIHLQMTR